MSSTDTSDPLAAAVAEADAEWLGDELRFAWRLAQDEATAAYEDWREFAGDKEYTVYLAAQDRADHAQDVLAAITRGKPS
jgi:hypothetical protein